jgi:excinuclease ABC subunit A
MQGVKRMNSSTSTGLIQVRGARTHNLYNVSLDVPRGKLVVFTGPSGSGKSSLVFDTIFAEGQRRYLATLPSLPIQLSPRRPDVDSISGLPPVLSVSQSAGTPRPRSTLATLTEIHDHLRLLWARRGTPYCPDCDLPIVKQTLAEISRQVLAMPAGRKIYLMAPLVFETPGDHAEVFQHIRRGGFLRARVDGVLFEIRDTPSLDAKKSHTIDLVVDRLVVRDGIAERLMESLESCAREGNGRVIVSDVEETGDWNDLAFSTKLSCPRCLRVLPDLEPRRFHFNTPHGACPACNGMGLVEEISTPAASSSRGALPGDENATVLCPECHGTRLNREARAVRYDAIHISRSATTTPLAPLSPGGRGAGGEGERIPSSETDSQPSAESSQGVFPLTPTPTPASGEGSKTGMSLVEVTALTVDDALAVFRAAEIDPAHPLAKVETILVDEITTRLHFLAEVGLGYLTLDRPASTLSGGELQRARLAARLGGGLRGVCFILDEPTLGLHPRDSERLIAALRVLQNRGNSLLVVEHDEAVMRHADYLVDLGPGAGPSGGRILAFGSFDEVKQNPDSVTAPYLREARAPRLLQAAGVLAPAAGSSIVIRGARHHNLRNIDVEFPLDRLIAVTGVSGSGKSSLVRDILAHAARKYFRLKTPLPGEHDSITGLEHVEAFIEADQQPLGRSPRSNAATYSGLFDELRRIYAQTRTAKIRGYTASRFSFNAKGGRCEECQGRGELHAVGAFVPDVTVPCPVCNGRRFNFGTLEVRFKGLTIADALDLPSERALDVFKDIPQVSRMLRAFVDVGLGYLPLGQPATRLSGGEAQRIKLATELGRADSRKTLFLLDEPTSGLHRLDVARLIGVVRKLVDAGNTAIVVEHHLDMIAAADWIIDLGPGAGLAGGNIVAVGPPSVIASNRDSITGRFLRG